MATPRIKSLTERRDVIVGQLKSYDEQVIERSQDLEGTEKANYESLTEELTKVTADLDEVTKREQLIARSMQTSIEAGTIVTPEAKVTLPAEAKRPENHGLIYHRGSEFNPISDLLAQARGDRAAIERIATHNEANQDRIVFDRATTTSSLGGLVVPEYLVNDVVPYAREGRPFADVMTKRPLTRKTTTIPAVTTPAAMGMVDGEGTTYTSANFATTGVDITAKTCAGYTDVSIEAVEFSSLDEGALYDELTKVYNQVVDYQTFQGSDANGQVEGIFSADNLGSVTASSATSGAAELYAKVVEAASAVHEGIYEEATHVVMSSKRWYKLLSEVGTDKRPLFGIRDSAPTNVLGNGDSTVRTFANLIVIIDNNIYTATSADTKVLVTRAAELWLLEQNSGRPTTLKVEALGAKQGLVTFVARGFIGFTAERKPTATTVISGLPVPSF